MDNVIQFPSDEARGWASWSNFVHEVVRSVGRPPEAAEHVLARVRPLFDILVAPANISIDVPVECVPAFEALHERVDVAAADLRRKVLTERVKRELELYILHGPV